MVDKPEKKSKKVEIILDLQAEPVRIGGQSQKVTKIVGFPWAEDQPTFLVVVDNRELFLFEQQDKKAVAVNYGEKGAMYEKSLICNVQIAFNSKFFAVGISECDAAT